MGRLYKRGDTWWIKYSGQNGKVYRESSKSVKKMVATRLLKRREGEIAEGRIPGICFDKTIYDQLAEDLENDYTINGQNVNDVQKRRIHLDKAFGGMRANQITTAGIKAFITNRFEDEAANATINRELAALKRMFRLGAQQTPPLVGQAPYIPMLKEKNSRRGFLEHDQFLKLHEALPVYLKNFVYFAYITGWRKNEISILTWSHIDRKNWAVRLEPGETKNEDARTVYADKNLKQIIRDQWVSRHKLKKPLEWLFPNRWGKDRLRQFDKVWKNALDTAALDPTLIFHDLRRTAVRNMVRAGIPERVAMQISGHKTRSVFDRYNIVSPGDLMQAAVKQQAYLESQEKPKEEEKQEPATAAG